MFKRLSRICVIPALAALLVGCGFHLRGSLPALGEGRTLAVTGIGPTHFFYGEFAQSLQYAGGSLAQIPERADAVLHILNARHSRRPITLGRSGRANTFDLWLDVTYEVLTPKGEIILPREELEVRRDYFNDQTSPLGQGAEEAQYRLEMQHEAAQTLLRRIAYTLKRKQGTGS